MMNIGTTGNSFNQKSVVSWHESGLTGIVIESCRDGGGPITTSWNAWGK